MRKRFTSSLGLVIALVSFIITITNIVIKIPDEILLRVMTVGLGIILVVGLVILMDLIFNEPPKKR